MAYEKKDIILDWIPTDALVEWAKAHFYHLPESINHAEIGYKEWMITMQEIQCELNSRNMWVVLEIKQTENFNETS
jgi:hypothetical protein